MSDLGVALGTVAHLCALRRTAAGGFRLTAALTLDALGALDEAGRDRCLLPLEALLHDLPRVELDTAAARRFGHGQPVAAVGAGTGRCQVWNSANALMGLGEIGPGGALLRRDCWRARLRRRQSLRLAGKTLWAEALIG